MEKVYLLEHCYVNDEYEDTKYMGVFSDKKKAREALEIIKQRSDFNKFPDGFLVSEMILDKIYWEKCFF